VRFIFLDEEFWYRHPVPQRDKAEFAFPDQLVREEPNQHLIAIAADDFANVASIWVLAVWM